MKNISVIIPTYNGLPLLQKFLPSVIASLDSGDELVIVDDCSTDKTVSWLIKEFALQPQLVSKELADEVEQFTGNHKSIIIQLIKNKSNQRFGQTVNRGVILSTKPYVLVLNNDVKPLPGIKKALLTPFDDKTMFAVGCLEYEMAAGSNQVQGGKNKLWFEKGMFMHSRADSFESGPTAWVSGGSGMFDREKWLDLGGFSKEYYPAYWEDVDLSYRAQKRGWKVWFERSAQVEHHHETTNNAVFGQKGIEEMGWRNAQTFCWNNGSIYQKVLYLLWKPYWLWKRIRHRISELQ